MDEQVTDPTPNAHHPRRTRAVPIAIAMSALIVACVSGIEDDEDLEFRAGCDGVEEYIDENGETVICVYTDEPGDGGGGDPCWDFPWLCYPGDGDGDAGDWGGDGGGEAGGGDGGEPPPEACTPYGNDCTTAQACCGSNVCAFGGERDTTWCQPLESSAWAGSCVDARTGSAVYRNRTVCRYTNGQETNSTCHSVQKASCVIGYNGDCGEGTYTIRISDLVQAPPGTCQG